MVAKIGRRWGRERISELPPGQLVICGRCGTRTYRGHDTPTPNTWHPGKTPRADGLHRRLTLCGACLGAAMTGLAAERRGGA